MHMKNRKRFLALAAAAAMVLAPCTAFATDTTTSPAIGNAGASGNVEGWVDKEIFTVELPTVATGTLDFILDPQGLIAATTNAAYTGKTFEANQTLFFEQASGGTNDYAHTSQKIAIKNKSSIPVDVTVDAVATGDAVSFSTDSAFTNSEAPEVYLAVSTGGAVETCIDPTEKKASVSTQLAAVPETNFEVKYNAGTYSYGLKDSVNDSVFPKFEFYLTGSCNKEADWADLTEVKPGVDLVWTVTAHSDAVEGICLLVNGTFWVGPDANNNTVAFSPDANITSVRVNGKDCPSSMTDNYVVVTWADIVGIGEDEVTSWTVTVVADGVTYNATYTLP